MFDSVRPHRRKPTRLPCPWDSPGKNTRVGCHFLLQCIKVKSEREVAQSCRTLSDPMDYSLPGSSINGIFQARVLEWGSIAFSGPRRAHQGLNQEPTAPSGLHRPWSGSTGSTAPVHRFVGRCPLAQEDVTPLRTRGWGCYDLGYRERRRYSEILFPSFQ